MFICFNVYLFFCLFRYTMSHITHLVKEKGSDCWWELPLETLLPEEVLAKVCYCLCHVSAQMVLILVNVVVGH